jgi:hypothetical protein
MSAVFVPPSTLRRHPLMRALGGLILCPILMSLGSPACAAEGGITEEDGYHPAVALLQQLPAPTIPDPVQVEAGFSEAVAFGDGIHVIPDQAVILDGTVLITSGPEGGLEVIACMPGGKNHESLILLEAKDAVALKTAFVGFLGLEQDGVPPTEASAIPARGFPLSLHLRWQPDAQLEPDSWLETDISTMVRDRVTDRPFPPLPYIYTGSQFVQTGEGPQLGLASTRSLIVNYDEPDALIASPFPVAMHDVVFEANSARAPLVDTPVQIIARTVQLPCRVLQGPDGGLTRGGESLDDQALVALLQEYFADPDPAALRAVAVEVTADAPYAHDQATRQRILEAAATAGVWAVPVFVLPTP